MSHDVALEAVTDMPSAEAASGFASAIGAKTNAG